MGGLYIPLLIDVVEETFFVLTIDFNLYLIDFILFTGL